MKNATFFGNYNDPILYKAKLGNTDNFTTQRQVYEMGNATDLRRLPLVAGKKATTFPL
ncbi:hypothetical protein LTR49_028905, partial [Elasticomyces elasticus]